MKMIIFSIILPPQYMPDPYNICIIYMQVFVKVGDCDQITEIPSETDGCLYLSNIQAQFPDTTGLRYRQVESNPWRAVKRIGDKFFQPRGGWGDQTYYVVKPVPGAV